jgi:hypothetical protein
MNIKTDALDIIRRGQIYKDEAGGLHIGDINALNTGDCYFIGQHMALVAKLAPTRGG